MNKEFTNRFIPTTPVHDSHLLTGFELDIRSPSLSKPFNVFNTEVARRKGEGESSFKCAQDSYLISRFVIKATSTFDTSSNGNIEYEIYLENGSGELDLNNVSSGSMVSQR